MYSGKNSCYTGSYFSYKGWQMRNSTIRMIKEIE